MLNAQPRSNKVVAAITPNVLSVSSLSQAACAMCHVPWSPCELRLHFHYVSLQKINFVPAFFKINFVPEFETHGLLYEDDGMCVV
jgi:hypothetical protein